MARVDSTVLIEGETGDGKGACRPRDPFFEPSKDKPFIAVNCAGLTESLLSSQLFGHKRGAFTGAIEDHQGLLEAANGGTLCLMRSAIYPYSAEPAAACAAGARDHSARETRPRKIDVRVLAATHRNLSEEAAKGSFRADLFYRIRVARISLPSLCGAGAKIFRCWPLLFLLNFPRRAESGRPNSAMMACVCLQTITGPAMFASSEAPLSLR